MPRRDGTGPTGSGSMTGRGLGFCTGIKPAKTRRGFGMGLGLAYRNGLDRGFNASQTSTLTQKELLQEEKDILQNRLKVIEKQLENL